MNHVIILAAGQGQRMNSHRDKMLLPIAGKPLIYYTLMAFNDHPAIDSVTLVSNELNKKKFETIIKEYKFPKVKKIVSGGLRRQNSVEKGLKSLEKEAKSEDIILVHNGANPLPSAENITLSIEKTKKTGACIVGHFITATIKEVDDQHIIKTHDRERLFAAETPQVTTFKTLKKSLETAKKNKFEATDEAMLLENIDQKVTYLEAHENNFKVTTQADYAKLRMILGDTPDDYRVGIGQDSHMFDDKKMGLTLGGILLKEEPKLKANSDGDVILHAIFNALSQAIGDMSLGFYADTECEKGITDSSKYLQIILEKIKKKGFEINSLGIMIEAAKPKIDPLVPKIKKNLRKILGVPSQRIGITATSGEQLTAFGDGLGIQCFVIASLKSTT